MSKEIFLQKLTETSGYPNPASLFYEKHSCRIVSFYRFAFMKASSSAAA